MVEFQNFLKMKDVFASRRQHFPEKFLLSGKFFLGGPWNGRGPKFWNTPPNQKPVGTALAKSKFKE
jgi:hypothetical protein